MVKVRVIAEYRGLPALLAVEINVTPLGYLYHSSSEIPFG